MAASTFAHRWYDPIDRWLFIQTGNCAGRKLFVDTFVVARQQQKLGCRINEFF
jgi:hypothetical protein